MAADKKWTVDQTNAICDAGGSLLVSAAAGSGKTTVLVERAMRIICDTQNCVPADSLFIITFTNAAAAELKSRLLQSLLQRIRADGQNNAYLRRQRILIQRAEIGTIDSFCKKLVTRQFNTLGIPADINVASEAQLFELKQSAMAQTMEEMYQNTDFADFAAMFGKSRSDKNAEEMIYQLYTFLRSMPFEEKLLQQMQDDYCKTIPLEKTLWGKVLLEQAYLRIKKAEKCLQEAIKIATTHLQLNKYMQVLNQNIDDIRILKFKIQNESYDSALNFACQMSFGSFPTIRGYVGPEKEQVSALRKKAKAQVEELNKHIFICSEKEYFEDLKALAPKISAFISACKLFSKKYFEAKIKEKVLDFSDFEHLTLRLLLDENQNRTLLAQSLCDKFSVIMVDEYQDTNALQNMIYESLANPNADNMFFVGDVKQSIYSFRQANPEIFLQKRASFAPYDAKHYPATITLGHNFRSAGSVIDAINDIFTQIMCTAVGDVEYNQNEKLYAGLQTPTDEDAVQLHLINTAQTENSDVEYVANLICDMLNNKTQVRCKNGMRDIKPDDICILLRSPKNSAQKYVKALEQRAVSAYAGTDENILLLPEIQPIIATMRIVDNPALDIPMAAALLSPMFGFSPQRLTELRLNTRNGSLYAALLQSQAKQEKEFVEFLSNIRLLAAGAPAYKVCNEIISQTGYDITVGAMPMGNSRRAAVRKFCEYVRSYAGNGGLSGFLRMVDNALSAGTSTASVSKSAPNGCVSIMSIHSSKGLEFPVCIVAGLSKKINLRDTTRPVLLHPLLGIGVNVREGASLYRTIMHEAIAKKIKNEQLSEEMRILYVAMTRAKDKLILCNAQKRIYPYIQRLCTELKVGGIDECTLQNVQSLGEWVTLAALMHKDSATLWQAAEMPANDFANTQGHIKIYVNLAPQPKQQTERQDFKFAALPDAKAVKEIENSFLQHLKMPKANDLPVKFSVSQLAHKAALKETVLARPSFMYKTGLSATEQGTAMHSFLQYADFNMAKNDLAAELNRLVDNQFISATLADKLPQDKVKSFLNSNLCTRILQADNVYREYDFITKVSADILQDCAAENQDIIVQGIADCIIIKNGTAELIDYKTDKEKTEDELRRCYASQLLLYKQAIEKRMNIKVVRCIIYSLQLCKEIDIK